MKIFALFFLLVINAFATQTFAATFTVTRNDDRNATCVQGATPDCSLREAVNLAGTTLGADTINFVSTLNGQTITLADVITVTDNTVFEGLGANKLTISGNNVTGIFYIYNNLTVTMRNLTLANANTPYDGGAIRGFGNISLTLDGMNIQNNKATGYYGGIMLASGGALVIRNSTIANNTARICGGLGTGATTTIVNSTISGNSTTQSNIYAGGFCNFTGTATLRNSTITQNTGSGDNGGGVWNSGTLYIGNTIIAGNIAANRPEIYNNGVVVSLGNNLVGDSADDSIDTNFAISYQPSDKRDVDPLLSVLQNNGGLTPTHALLTGSPAINAGDNSLAVDPSNGNAALAFDQRGAGYSRVQQTAVDIGAFELQQSGTPTGQPTSKEQCKNDGWATFISPRRFRNQGDCIQFVNTGR